VLALLLPFYAIWEDPLTEKKNELQMNSKFRTIAVALVFACVLGTLLTSTAFAQVADGNVVGSVFDQSAAAVPGATVEIENVSNGIKASATTDESGFYRFNNLLIGRYKVTASAPGFAATTREVVVELSKTVTANVSLALGGVAAEIQVSTTIDTTTAQVQNTFTGLMATELPLASNPAGGGVLNLALTGAGITSSGGVGVGMGPAVGGNRPRNNNFTIEGADNNRKDVTGPVLEVPGDATAEFVVLQNQFSAEYGHSSGGQFNSVLRGGGSEFHGSIYEYFQNRKLNAIDQSLKRNFNPGPGRPAPVNPRFDQNTIGFSAGGPLVENKVFGFANFDYQPLGQASFPSASTYTPTAAGYAMLDSIPGLSRTNLDILKKYAAPSPTAARSTTVTGSDGVTRTIPTGILEIIGPSFQNTYRWLASLDYNMSERNQFRGRYITNEIKTINTDANLPTFWVQRPITSNLATISHFRVISPSITNELRGAYTRYNADFPLPPGLQFPGLDIFPNITLQTDLQLNLGPAGNSPQATIQNTYQIVENLSMYKGRHDLKFGGDFRDMIAASTFIQRSRGDYVYTTAGGISALERYLRDFNPDNIAQRNVGGKPYIGNNYALYFYGNDNWKITRNLTLNLGLRYEFTSVPRSMQEFELNSLADVPGVLTFFAPKPQKKNFAPRVGFAYTPGTSARTTVRGGFGMAYDQIFDNVGTNSRPPQATSTFDAPLGGTVPGFLANGAIKPETQTTGLNATTARNQTSSWLPDQKVGYTINWNLGIQRVFGNDYTAELRYLGNRGVHLLFQRQINRIAIVTANHNLPTFFAAPSAATLNGLTLSYQDLINERNARGNIFAPTFPLNITAYEPVGNSEYHGMALEVNKRFSSGMLFKGAYTWSHLMDDSTAEVFSTVLSPRRPEDFFDIRKEWASSALDHRHRFSLAWVYQVPWFRNGSSILRNVVGNWQISGTYIAESPQFVTVQSTVDSNLNGDAAADRSVINIAGTAGTSSDVTPVCNAGLLAGRACSIAAAPNAVVGYVANDPNAYYVRAQVGAYATGGRNTLSTPIINNFDLSLAKIISVGENKKFEIRGDFYNSFNHPQYTAGRINRVNSTARTATPTFLQPGHPDFGKFDRVWSSNPRQVQLTAKFTF